MSKQELRVIRHFDLDLKLDLVRQVELGSIGVTEISRTYNVSRRAIYKWLHKYSDIYKNQKRVIVESKSLSQKNKEQLEKIKELEAALGRKQMRIDYLERIVSIASEHAGHDIEKKNKRLS